MLGAVDNFIIELICIAKIGRRVDDMHRKVFLPCCFQCAGDQGRRRAVRGCRKQCKIGAFFDQVQPVVITDKTLVAIGG